LHFTKEIFSSLKKKNIDTGFVTLHVGAGTFKPVKSSSMEGHEMHAEWIDVPVKFIRQLTENLSNDIFCVGTTSVRTVESLYWMGVKTFLYPEIKFEQLKINQWEVYEEELFKTNLSANKSLTSLCNYLITKNLNRLFIQTQIIIAPGYSYKITNGIITNFHQPKSTLLLLVAAMIGDNWKKMYDYALKNNFRFLSYGDGCLIYKGISES
jgi:S-adenosylmethionine:tRNA ribosyltransferase-isomerase